MLLIELLILSAFIIVVGLALYKNFYPNNNSNELTNINSPINQSNQPVQHTIIIQDNPYIVDNYPYYWNLPWYGYRGNLDWYSNDYNGNYTRNNHHNNHYDNHRNNHRDNHSGNHRGNHRGNHH